jgi:hypothetical protein
MIRSAYLRVYIPSDAAVPVESDGVSVDGLRWVGDFGLLAGPVRKQALMTVWNGRSFACPTHPRLRVLEGLLAFRATYPGVTGDVLVPEDAAARAAEELARLRRRDPSLRSHILASPWHVPLRWFAAFDPDEREMVEREGHTSIRYRTTVGGAVARLEHSMTVLEGAGFEDSVTEQVQELTDWLTTFPVDSLVELDYGGVAELFGDGDLAIDESAADLRASLKALEEGDLDAAGEHYGRAASRWAAAQALTHMN